MPEFGYKLQSVCGSMLQTGPTTGEQAAVSDHFAYLQDLAAKGRMVFVGRTMTTHENTVGLAVFSCRSPKIKRVGF